MKNYYKYLLGYGGLAAVSYGVGTFQALVVFMGVGALVHGFILAIVESDV